MGLIMGKILFIVLVALAIVIGGPIATILSLNTLFGLNIDVNATTWLASFWLTSIIGSSVIKKK
jgi:hypothetical protein